MRRASYPFLTIMAAVIATGASAAAPNAATKPAAQPALRTGSTGTATAQVQNPGLRKSTTAVVAATKATPAKTAKASVVKPKVVQVVMPKVKVVRAGAHKVATKHATKSKHLAMHRGSTISLPLDEVRVVAFSQPVSTIYVGNPMVADVSMIDSRHAFVLGKAFGATNIVALDSDGKQVVNDAVNVYGHTGSIVILHRGTQQATYNCAGARCETAPVPGDGKDSYSSSMEQMASHQDANTRAASATTSAGR